MREAKPPLPQYALMAWCSVKAQGQLYLYLGKLTKLLSAFLLFGFIIRLKTEENPRNTILNLLDIHPISQISSCTLHHPFLDYIIPLINSFF
jgi:hypothetical protein